MSTPKALQKAKASGLEWAVVPPPKRHPFPDMGHTLYRCIEGSWVPITMGHVQVLDQVAAAANKAVLPPFTGSDSLPQIEHKSHN